MLYLFQVKYIHGNIAFSTRIQAWILGKEIYKVKDNPRRYSYLDLIS